MNGATSPLVTAYLADLDRALAGADPSDRLEIVDAVREHIDAELGASPSQAEIAAVLRRLGTADDVAAAWAVGSDRPASWAAGAGPGPAGGAAWTGQPAAGEAGWTSPQLRPSAHGLVPIPPGEPTAPRTSPWLVALVVILGLAFGLPLVVSLLAALFLIPVSAAAPWWVDIVVGLVMVAATIGSGIAWRRSTTHRRARLAAFLTCLVVTLATVIGLGAGQFGGGFGSGVQVGPVEEFNAPTPSPASDGLP